MIFLCIGAFFALLLIWIFWDNRRIQIKNWCIEEETIDSDFCIVHLSDLHGKRFGKNNCRLIQAVRQAKPDLIAFTGDAMDRFDASPPLSVFQDLCKIAPVVYVPGNHDYGRTDREDLLKAYQKAGAIVLRHQQMQWKGVSILGLDQIGYGNQTEAALQKFDAAPGFHLLLCHQPQFFKQYQAHSISLILAGHAHGGQFILPGLGGVYAPGQGLFPKYYRGLSVENGVKMIVSRGLGNSGFPIRLGNPPEILVIHCKKKRAEF